MDLNPKIEETWKKALSSEFHAPYFSNLKATLIEEKKQYSIFPPGPEIFNSFNLTPLDQVKVVIIGQDPYHGEGQAHGLSFSVRKGIKIPPSLVNIFKEQTDDLSLSFPSHGELTSWAKQGVLLLNASLTVRKGEANSTKALAGRNLQTPPLKLFQPKYWCYFSSLGWICKEEIILNRSIKTSYSECRSPIST